MKKQRTTEWLENIDADYHIRQFETPYRSTVAFCDWLEKQGLIGGEQNNGMILDAGSGSGANIKYLGERFPCNQYLGVDLNKELVDLGNEYFQSHELDHRLMKGDLFDLSAIAKNNVEGIVSFQTLSWLPGYQDAIRSMASVESRWIAASSLFYDGPLEFKIEVDEFTSQRQRKALYNIYSIDRVREQFSELGYQNFYYSPFEIDIDLVPPLDKGLGTYTRDFTSGEKAQFTGPLMLPWYFIVASK
jgi:SAM-dependent methyltransferase